MYKLSIIDEEEDNFIIILINSVLEDYKMAFHLNKIMPFQFSKSLKPEFIKNKTNHNFEFYKYENEIDNLFWYLIPNKKTIPIELKTVGLFHDNIEEQVYFLSELKKFDYIIKYTDENIEAKDFIKKINKINNVSTAIKADLNKIKNSKYLKF
jgi:hypothetical protein